MVKWVDSLDGYDAARIKNSGKAYDAEVAGSNPVPPTIYYFSD